MQILSQGQSASTLSFTTKDFTETSLAVWLGSAAFSACLAHTSDAVVPTLIAAFCPRGCVPLGPPPFPVRARITLLLPVGTRWNCCLQSNERKTWTLRRTFPSQEDNTSVPFIRGTRWVGAVRHFGSKTCKCGRCEEDDFQGEYFPTSAQAVVRQLRSFTTILSLVGWLGSRTLQKIYLQSPKEPE